MYKNLNTWNIFLTIYIINCKQTLSNILYFLFLYKCYMAIWQLLNLNWFLSLDDNLRILWL